MPRRPHDEANSSARASTSARLLTAEDILNAADTDDASADWRYWSIEKCERERHRIPELDEWLRRDKAELEAWIDTHARVMRLVDPGYRSGSTPHSHAVYALLAHAFNLDPDQVSAKPVSVIYGYARAYRLLNGSKLAGAKHARSDSPGATPAAGAPAGPKRGDRPGRGRPPDTDAKEDAQWAQRWRNWKDNPENPPTYDACGGHWGVSARALRSACERHRKRQNRRAK